MDRPIRIAALHDLSSVGRCALTVILPILSVQGHQCCPVPTALLSSHTGGFDAPYFLEADVFLNECLARFKSMDLTMEAVYTG